MDHQQNIITKPLNELTLEDVIPHLRQLIKEEVGNCLNSKEIPSYLSGIKDSTIEHLLANPRLYVVGLKGLADLLHCSLKSAYNYKRSGKYDPAIHRIGKRYIINKEIALEIANKSKISHFYDFLIVVN